MKLFSSLLGSMTLVVIFTASDASACSSFLVEHNKNYYMGKNYDWYIDYGLVMYNPRGLSKKSLVVKPTDTSISWTAKYASITFNQYGNEFPLGGLNEAGLAIESIWLSDTSDQPVDQRATINELQWVQYQLDNYSTIQEIIDNINKIRISRLYGKIHYFGCDKSGACASFEILNGSFNLHHGKNLPFKVLTNNTYLASEQFAKNCNGLGGKEIIPTDQKSLSRFARASHLISDTYSTINSPIARTFSILDQVKQINASRSNTQWTIVYDLSHLRIYFKSRNHPDIKHVLLTSFPQQCSNQKYVFNINQDSKGDILKLFKPDIGNRNNQLVQKSFSPIQKHIPATVIEMFKQYPQGTYCTL